MSDPAALLTKAQRRRIRERFADLDGDRTRRERQRIRERLAAGVDDFGQLAAYPDEQVRLALDDHDDEELVRALANGQIVLERLRESRGIDRDRVCRRAATRRDEIAGGDDPPGTVTSLAFETEADRRNRVEREVRERSAPGIWDRRATVLLRFAAAMFLPLVLIWLVDEGLGVPVMDATNLWAVFLLLGSPAVAGALAIELAQTLKHDFLPACRALADDPRGAIVGGARRIGGRVARRLRRSWERL
jgi:hypothetical protein